MTLLDRPTYRTLSGDTDSLDADVDGALVAAQQQLEEALGRGYHDPTTGAWVGCLEMGTRTEKVRLHHDGRAYPLATPIQSVTTPTNTQVWDGTTVLSLFADQNPLWDILVEPYRYGPGGAGGEFDSTLPVATLTYTGGYTAASLPRKLRQALVDLTRVELTAFDPLAAGVKSANVDGTSVVYAEAPDRGGVTDAILDEVWGFRRREIGH